MSSLFTTTKVSFKFVVAYEVSFALHLKSALSRVSFKTWFSTNTCKLTGCSISFAG